MPGIQNLGQPGLQNLQRQQLESGPLGQVGNLRFKAEPGATPRTSGPNVFQRFGQFLSKVAFYVGASPAQRAQQFVLDQARDNSRRIGNLLGNLTASPNDRKAQAKIAEGLARLGDLSGGDFSRLPGGQQALNTYLGELGLPDLSALRSGVLGDPQARQATLDRVDPPHLRAQAAQVLDQIVRAMDQHLAGQVVREPLSQIQGLLSARPVDGVALEAQLGKLSEGLAMMGGDKLGVHLQGLSRNELRTLRDLLHGGKLDGAKQALTQIRDPDARPLRIEDAPDRVHETLDPGLIQSGRIQHGEAMLDRLSLALDKEIQARIEGTHPGLTDGLQAAIKRGDRSAIARALFDLNGTIGALQDAYGTLPEDTLRAVRAQVSGAMTALRNPDTNPEGPLTRDSLQRLDDNALGLLRRSGNLRGLGLQLDRDGARAEGLARVQALSQQVVQGMTGLMRTLGADPVDMPALMRQLRDLSELELQRSQQLAQLGHYGDMASVDDREAMVEQAFRQALAGLAESGEKDAAERALSQLGLLDGLEVRFGSIAFGLSSIVGDGGYEQGGPETLKRVSTTQHLLAGIAGALRDAIPGRVKGEAPATDAVELPGEFYTSLMEQYGVRCNPGTFESTLMLSDGMRARLAPHLEEPVNVSVHPTHKVTLPVRGTDIEFSVSSSFFKDGIERPSISLSVRGPGPDGSVVRSSWPDGVPQDRRGEAMGEALDALTRIAGPAAEPLTRLMNQQLGAGILKGLQDMGKDSPFKLEDGSVVMPVGSGRFHFDVERFEDGSFRIGAVMTIPIKDAVGLDQNGVGMPVAMDPSLSWAQVSVVLSVSPDGQQVRMSEPPQFRHHFVLRPQDDGL
ncbi:MAG TPA: hypothetical protein VFM22_06695 [Castellaniella sp.]|nr:hypothetical protein [Castellaniella sp.]